MSKEIDQIKERNEEDFIKHMELISNTKKQLKEIDEKEKQTKSKTISINDLEIPQTENELFNKLLNESNKNLCYVPSWKPPENYEEYLEAKKTNFILSHNFNLIIDMGKNYEKLVNDFLDSEADFLREWDKTLELKQRLERERKEKQGKFFVFGLESLNQNIINGYRLELDNLTKTVDKMCFIYSQNVIKIGYSELILGTRYFLKKDERVIKEVFVPFDNQERFKIYFEPYDFLDIQKINNINFLNKPVRF